MPILNPPAHDALVMRMVLILFMPELNWRSDGGKAGVHVQVLHFEPKSRGITYKIRRFRRTDVQIWRISLCERVRLPERFWTSA